jgi:XTP/dITP diphosphohydrolase
VELCFASNNNHKLREIRSLLEPDFRILSLAQIGCVDELPETQPTIEGNALQKAGFVFERYHVPCFADDTGLEVEALNNAPGVYSARYAGERKSSDDNINLLLKNLGNSKNRNARFRTVIALIDLEGIHQFEGIIQGTITHEIRGAEGFGYDPVFQPEGFDKTFAEMTLAKKNQMSHRARAVEKLVSFLEKYRSNS